MKMSCRLGIHTYGEWLISIITIDTSYTIQRWCRHCNSTQMNRVTLTEIANIINNSHFTKMIAIVRRMTSFHFKPMNRSVDLKLLEDSDILHLTSTNQKQ